jgi:hypothetical protein
VGSLPSHLIFFRLIEIVNDDRASQRRSTYLQLSQARQTLRLCKRTGF